ncbi:MAG TPA: hypothetical protein DCQ87_03240 [Lachnospiraceae bacterium]|nr:hypothetical protein [Lachnospiraceae bacterium]
MVVQHNMQAANANRMLGLTVNAQQKSTEKLSSGYKINRAADDAAGLAISEKMRSQIRGLDRASTNAQDGISVVQTAEGALNEVHSMLQRMNELATQAANDTNTSIDRGQIQKEIDQLTSEIDRVSSTTQFNTMNLLDGSFTDKNLQVGSLSGQNIKLSIGEMSAKGLGLASDSVAHGVIKSITAGKTQGSAATDSDFAAVATLKTNISDKTGAGHYEYDAVSKAWHINNKKADIDITSADVAKTANTLDFSSDVKAGKANASFDIDASGNITNVSGIVAGGIAIDDSKAVAADNAVLDNSSYVVKDVPAGTYTADENGVFSDGNGNSFTVTFKAGTNGATTGLKAAANTKITIEEQKASGYSSDLKVDSNAHAGDAMDKIQKAIDKVSDQRALLGATQNRLEHTIANLDNVSENTQAAESRIRDTDMAKEMVTYSKNNILQQAGQSMLAQANQSNQGVLSLLQ